jgi:hypothetical protein
VLLGIRYYTTGLVKPILLANYNKGNSWTKVLYMV